MSYFNSLASLVNEKWLQENYDELRLPGIASDALAWSAPHRHLGYADIIEWLTSTTTLPFQAKLDEAFGQPPLTMYWDGRFQIDVLFWHTATTGIHQHAFSGAFAVLAGSSMHCVYQFELQQRINEKFLLGSIHMRECNILEEGAIREIGYGSSLIHSLFHLDVPSVTVVVRTCLDASAGPEYVYYLPSVALDPARSNILVTKQLQALELLIRIGSRDLEHMASSILSKCDLHTAYLVLLKLRLSAIGANSYERLLVTARRRHGEHVKTLIAAIEEERRRHLIADCRRTVFDPTHRFFLALLMNLPDRESIDDLIRLRHPEADVSALIESWISELSAAGLLGIEIDDDLRLLVHHSLEGISIAALIEKLKESYPANEIEREAANIHEACRRIKQNLFLRPLFILRGGQ